MKAIFLPALLSFALSLMSPAQTYREVVRDTSGRIVQTVERQKQAGGTVQATTRDASGRIIGTATTSPNSGGSTRTNY
jgi:YD repeat-containing protein